MAKDDREAARNDKKGVSRKLEKVVNVGSRIFLSHVVNVSVSKRQAL